MSTLKNFTQSVTILLFAAIIIVSIWFLGLLMSALGLTAKIDLLAVEESYLLVFVASRVIFTLIWFTCDVLLAYKLNRSGWFWFSIQQREVRDSEESKDKSLKILLYIVSAGIVLLVAYVMGEIAIRHTSGTADLLFQFFP